MTIAVSQGGAMPKSAMLPSPDEFLRLCRVGTDDLDRAEIEWRELKDIFDHHRENTESLESRGLPVLERLRACGAVHSVRMRVKGAARVVNKVVRKRTAERPIGLNNYTKELTDLVGVRALHLYKDDWREIHSFLEKEFRGFVEQPIAYHRKGDLPQWIARFREADCRPEEHQKMYRSVHYLVESRVGEVPTVVEIQVRTLMEEAWSEIDHRINYPVDSPFRAVQLTLGIFNRLAGSADELGSVVTAMHRDLEQQAESEAAIREQRDKMQQQRDALLSRSPLGDDVAEEFRLKFQRLDEEQERLMRTEQETKALEDVLQILRDYGAVANRATHITDKLRTYSPSGE